MTRPSLKAYEGMKVGFTPKTGNHKGCPYDGLAGAYFHSKDGFGQYY